MADNLNFRGVTCWTVIHDMTIESSFSEQRLFGRRRAAAAVTSHLRDTRAAFPSGKHVEFADEWDVSLQSNVTPSYFGEWNHDREVYPAGIWRTQSNFERCVRRHDEYVVKISSPVPTHAQRFVWLTCSVRRVKRWEFHTHINRNMQNIRTTPSCINLVAIKTHAGHKTKRSQPRVHAARTSWWCGRNTGPPHLYLRLYSWIFFGRLHCGRTCQWRTRLGLWNRCEWMLCRFKTAGVDRRIRNTCNNRLTQCEDVAALAAANRFNIRQSSFDSHLTSSIISAFPLVIHSRSGKPAGYSI